MKLVFSPDNNLLRCVVGGFLHFSGELFRHVVFWGFLSSSNPVEQLRLEEL